MLKGRVYRTRVIGTYPKVGCIGQRTGRYPKVGYRTKVRYVICP